MSRENVELVRQGLETFNRGEWSEIFERWFHPEIEWSDPPGFPGAGVHHGRAEVEARFEELEEMLEGFSVRPEELFDAGDQVVCFVRIGRTRSFERYRSVAAGGVGPDRPQRADREGGRLRGPRRSTRGRGARWFDRLNAVRYA